MTKCPSCGADNEDSAVFCDNCGAALRSHAISLSMKCPVCGTLIPPGAMFCDNCGASLSSVSQAAQDALLAGSGAVAGDITFGDSGVAVGRDITGRDVYISYNTAFERVVGSTVSILNQLEQNYRQTREQAHGWFRFSLIAAAAGFFLIGIGAITAILGYTTAGIITAVSSIIPNVAAALFFVQSKKADERVDAITDKLTDARELYTLVEIANTISDIKSQDKLKTEIVRKALRVGKRVASEKPESK